MEEKWIKSHAANKPPIPVLLHRVIEGMTDLRPSVRQSGYHAGRSPILAYLGVGRGGDDKLPGTRGVAHECIDCFEKAG